jgi:hypothetical protein
MSGALLLRIVRRSIEKPHGTRAKLRDAYLERWTAYAPLDELRQVFEWVDRAKTLHAVVSDGTWLRCLFGALADRPLSPVSADACTVRWRQYYYARVVRRLFEPGS